MGSLPDGGDGVVGICLAQIHQTVHILHIKHGASQEAPVVKYPQVRFLGQKDTPGEGMATSSSILAWRIPWTEKPGRLQSIGLQSWTRLK